jgi:hypothetical protein
VDRPRKSSRPAAHKKKRNFGTNGGREGYEIGVQRLTEATMRQPIVDGELNCFMNSIFSEPAETDDAPDPLAKFREDCELAGTLGRNGHQHVAALQEEAAQFDARFDKAMFKTRASDEWNEEITTGTSLEKRHSGTAGSSASHQWIKNRMALGKSASEVIDEWCTQFPHRRADIERELRAIAAELDA